MNKDIESSARKLIDLVLEGECPYFDWSHNAKEWHEIRKDAALKLKELLDEQT